METKDQHNQNPEEVIKNQEENSLISDEQPGNDIPQVESTENNEAIATEEISDASLSEEPLPVTLEENQLQNGKAQPEEDSDEASIQPAEGQLPVTLQEVEPVAEAGNVVVENEVVSATEGNNMSQDPADITEQEIVSEVVEKEKEPETSKKDSVPEVVEKGIISEESGDIEHDGEEDHEDVEELHEEEVSDFEGLSREQLVEKLEDLVKNPDVNVIKGAVSLVKVAFLKLNKEFKQDEYKKLVEQNEEHESETPTETPVLEDDPIEERFKAAFNIYKYNKSKYNEEQEKIKIQNLEAKNKILEELKELINSEETLKKTYDEFKNLQDRWKTIGMVPKNEINTLWQNYHFLVEKFFDKVKINKELKDLDLKKNLEAKIQLCEKAEELVLETSIIKSFKQLQQYHEEWKEIGPVPQDKKDELWERFKSATEKINDRRREYYSEIQDGQEQNLAAKLILCEKAEQVLSQEIDSLKGWQDASKQITELLNIWKTIGPAPKKQNNEIWARFKSSLDNFFNAKKEFFNKLKEQQMHNYNLKLDLCLQAEALKNSNDWKNTTKELVNLQSEWKNIGPVPKKQSDKIWKRFRAACDEFFSNKNEYFKNIQSHEDENLRLKLDLIERVKTFEVGEDRNQAVESLKDFQRQWMDIGFIPIKEKERLQNEFRSAINKHFEKLKMDSFAIGAQNYRSRIDKISKDSPDAGRIISKERNFLVGKIQQLNEDIKLWENNIGFFAASKTANLLKLEFEKKIAKAKEEVAMLEAKLKMLRESNQ